MEDINFNSISDKEIIFKDVSSLNDSFIDYNDSLKILHVNIRSLNSNLVHLQTLVERLKVKPSIIICSEAWLLNCTEFGDLTGYLCFSNNSIINKADGLLMYINDKLQTDTIVEEYGSLKILSTTLEIKNNELIKISGIYRCFGLKEEIFIKNMLEF